MTTPIDEPLELVGATEQTLTITTERVTAPLVIPDADNRGIRRRVVDPSRVLVSVENIQADRNPGIGYAVYLNLPEGDDPETATRHRVGIVSLFGIEVINDPDSDHSDSALRHIFQASEVVRTLEEAGDWNPSSITVSVEPFDFLTPVAADDRALSASEEGPTLASAETDPATPLELPTVQIGRVSLLVS